MDRGLKFNISAQAYEATITQYQNRQRHYQKWKLQDNIFDEYRCKNSQQNISKPNPTTEKRSCASAKLDSS